MKLQNLCLALVASCLLSSMSHADYANIVIDGDFTDWSAVSTLATDGADNPGSIDFSSLQIANDESFLYFRYLLHEPINPNGTGSGVFLAIDEDNDTATGYNIFGLGLVGSEAGWQNNFPFEQANDPDFNTGDGLTGATYLASPYNTGGTTSVEVSIPQSATHTVGGANVFPADGETIGFLLWTEEGYGDTIGGNYTFAAVPEPSSFALLSAVALSLLTRRRRRVWSHPSKGSGLNGINKS